MRFARVSLMCGLLLLLGASIVTADTEPLQEKSWLWVGSHYTDFTDSPKKVGEYNLGNDEFLPELGFYRFERHADRWYNVWAYYYDDQNIWGRIKAKTSDKLSLDIKYSSLVRQTEQDLLENMNAREYFPTTGTLGGKQLTHELKDAGADYHYNRQELLTKLDLLLARDHNVHLQAAHRSIVMKGHEQKIANSHCFSCHLVSDGARVNRETHSVEVGVQGDVNEMTLGYQFGYRKFASDAGDYLATYDEVRHPADPNPVTAAEFQSRQVFGDEALPAGVLPETEKMSHKLRLKGKVGQGQLASALAYSKTTNQNVDLSTTGIQGYVNYSLPVNPKTRLVARVDAKKITADDPDVDLPTFRDGKAGPQTDFDFTRYSSLDRSEAKATVEVTRRMSPRFTLAGMLGYHMVNRDDYPFEGDGTHSGTFIGQAKANYRKGLKYSTRLKYRFEKTSDPFMSGRGLFESPMHDALQSGFKFIFYSAREDFRYQNITTAPTDQHELEWQSTWRPDKKLGVNLGLKFRYDKNGDLDSLDVKHTTMQPFANLTLTPSPKWSLTAGFRYDQYKSRGPVTVALFDG
ncbi:MAG: GSU2204 family CXXCH-containing (seleno)protein [bacterium]